MTDYSPDYTPRYKLKYTAVSLSHTLLLRGFRGEAATATIARARDAAALLFDTWDGSLPTDCTYIAAFYAAEDSSIFLPAAVPAGTPAGPVDPATYSPQRKITSLGYSGRTAGGHRASLYFWGVFNSPDTTSGSSKDFILTGVENASVATTVSGLNSLGLAGNDGETITWYNQVTIKINDFWLRRVRQGSA